MTTEQPCSIKERVKSWDRLRKHIRSDEPHEVFYDFIEVEMLGSERVITKNDN